MLLNKTERARAALIAGSSSGLGMLDRRILIVTDGRRTLNEVMSLLGADILPAIDRLIRDGYIDDGRAQAHAVTPQAPSAQGLGGAFTGLIRAATEAVQARTEQIRTNSGTMSSAVEPAASQPPPMPTTDFRAATTTSAPRPQAPGGQRRSLVAAKMYIVDMLQLQRHPDAVELKARIQFTSGQAELLDAVLDGTRVLLQLTNESYGERIATRLGEVLPEEFLSALNGAVTSMRTPVPAGTPQLKVVSG